MALVNQKMGGPQGNANAAFYALASLDDRASCASNTVGANNGCNFHDVTTDTNAVPCVANSPDCHVLHSGDKVGIASGYSSTVGYDLATGLGSVNAGNLVNNWHLVAVSTAANSVTVPNVVGSSQASGTAAIAKAGLALGTLTIQASKTTPKGMVISEAPLSGTRVAPGTKVNVVISSGPPLSAVPKTIGSTQAAAAAAIAKAGLIQGTLMTKTSTTVLKGEVISESPVAGTLVAAGSKVNLVISHGRT
jgi:hypothetical protein